jgi:outer membrane protein assembly factor BamA
MKAVPRRVFIALLISFLLGPPTANAESDMASEVSPMFDAYVFEWAYGQVIDTVSVKGNAKTKSIALLRELESRVGTQLDRIKLERDHRYLSDLSSIATVEVAVYPVREGGCGLNFTVTERPLVFLKLVYPIVEYDFNNERFRFGLKVNDRNFRRRLESFSVGYTRNSVGDDNAGIGWSTAWIGWQHIGLGAWATYYHRGESIDTSYSVVEQSRVTTALSLPLTDSRISFSRIIGGFTYAKNRLAKIGAEHKDEVLISPSLGFSLDRRNSPLKPSRGELFWVDVQANRVLNGNGSTYYQLRNDIRFFRPLTRWTVVAAQSNVSYQFGRFPEYIRFGMGGAGTLRGFSAGQFEGNHRWIQSLETRISPFPTWIFSLPYAKVVDVSVSGVLFVDGGIVWDNDEDFRTERWHVGYGFGLRIYSPFQDVVGVDLGFNRQGDVLFYFRTGVRF